jgi:alkylation response protein AidB-like acyl-CoA dehydrogenase
VCLRSPRTCAQADRQHQAITSKLAEMGTRVEAARLLTIKAARMKDAGQRSDIEAGMDARRKAAGCPESNHPPRPKMTSR